jgi:hypothetical protein
MAIAYSPKIVTDGLRFYYDAANFRSYPGSGSVWTDISGNGFNASLINGVGYNSNNLGSMVLDGTDDIIHAPSVNTIGAIPNQTYEIWVKSSGLGSGKSLGGLICPDYGQVSAINSNGAVRYQLYNNVTSSYIVNMDTTGVNCFDNQWHHIICTRNSTDAYIYVDNVVRASGSGGGSWSGTTIWSGMSISIGNNPNDVYYNLLGNISVAKIYNIYFTAANVDQNFNAVRSRYGI